MIYEFSYPNTKDPKQIIKKMIALNGIPPAENNRKVSIKVFTFTPRNPHPFVESVLMSYLRQFKIIPKKQVLRAKIVEFLLDKKDPRIHITLED